MNVGKDRSVRRRTREAGKVVGERDDGNQNVGPAARRRDAAGGCPGKEASSIGLEPCYRGQGSGWSRRAGGRVNTVHT